jgi:hypothetical protein
MLTGSAVEAAVGSRGWRRERGSRRIGPQFDDHRADPRCSVRFREVPGSRSDADAVLFGDADTDRS